MVRPFLGVAYIRIKGDRHHDSAMIVVNAAPVSVLAVELVTHREMFGARDSVAVVQIEHAVEEGITVRIFGGGATRKDFLYALFEYLPLDRSVEIVGHEKTAAQQIIAQFL